MNKLLLVVDLAIKIIVVPDKVLRVEGQRGSSVARMSSSQLLVHVVPCDVECLSIISTLLD